MVETFGAVAGAMSIAGLFNNCVDTFKYIQLGRHFKDDYGRCQLKLDVAEVRLGRWGEVVGVNIDSRFTSAAALAKGEGEGESKSKIDVITMRILTDMTYCFKAAREKSERYADGMDKQQLAVCGEDDMDPESQKAHVLYRAVARTKAKTASLTKKVAWAVYDSDALEGIINEITGWISQLETLYPREPRLELVRKEVVAIDDVRILRALRDAAHGTDPALEDAVSTSISIIRADETRTRTEAVRSLNTDSRVKLLVGDHLALGFPACEIPASKQPRPLVGNLSARGDSRVQVGDSYGGKGIFDD